MSTRKHIFKIFGAWNDTKEERWLEQMAQEGWHLVSGPMVYSFEKGAPAQVRYRLDYRNESGDLDEYLKLCRDSGWERVFSFAGSQYFRTASPTAPEIYTDAASRVAKYRRLMNTSVLLAVTTMLGNVVLFIDSFRDRSDPVETVFRWAVAALALAWVYTLGRLFIRIGAQKRSAGGAPKL
jgi:hypothetical protein